jgi:hypothetical protein
VSTTAVKVASVDKGWVGVPATISLALLYTMTHGNLFAYTEPTHARFELTEDMSNYGVTSGMKISEASHMENPGRHITESNFDVQFIGELPRRARSSAYEDDPVRGTRTEESVIEFTADVRFMGVLPKRIKD